MKLQENKELHEQNNGLESRLHKAEEAVKSNLQRAMER